MIGSLQRETGGKSSRDGTGISMPCSTGPWEAQPTKNPQPKSLHPKAMSCHGQEVTGAHSQPRERIPGWARLSMHGTSRMSPTALELPSPERLCQHHQHHQHHPQHRCWDQGSACKCVSKRKNARPALETSSPAIVRAWQPGLAVNKRQGNIPPYTCLGFSGWFSWPPLLALQQCPACSAPLCRAGLNGSV